MVLERSARPSQALGGMTRVDGALLAAIALATLLAAITRYAHGVSHVVAFAFAGVSGKRRFKKVWVLHP